MKKQIDQHNQHNLISRSRLRLLFKTPSVQYLFTARNASHKAIVVSNRTGNYQLHAVDFSNGFHRQITHRKGGVLFGSISPDGQYIYFLNDKTGSEHAHFMRIPFYVYGGRSIDMTPHLKPYFSYSTSASDDAKTLVFTASLNSRNNVFVTREEKGGACKTKTLYTSANALSESICSPDGTYACVAETKANTKQSTLLLLSTTSNEHAVRSRRFDSVTPLVFSQSTTRPTILALARIGNWLRPILYDFTSKRILAVRHHAFRGDIWVLDWNEGREEMILCDVYQAQQKLYMYNTRTRTLRRIGPRNGSFNFHFGSVVRLADNSLILKWHDFNTSPCLIHLHAPDYDTWDEIPEWSGNIKTNYDVRSVWMHSSDKQRVQMWIVRPKDVKNPPFVIDVHGGPHGVIGDEFSPEAHAWLESGFGYCAVNYRGSIGFGRKFERKIYGNPGHWEVEDIAAARNWLIQHGYTVSEKIILYGWSWGGYVVLLALGKYPSLWSCGIAGAAIADCIMQYEDEPAYFKAQDQERFRGTPHTARARYVRSSPITYATHIQAPILLFHGKNDARCPERQIRYFVNTLKKLGGCVSIEWFTSGHTGEFTDTALRIHLMDKALRFSTICKKMPLKNKVCLEGRGWS